MVRMKPPRLSGLQWVVEGRPEVVPASEGRQFPGIVVELRQMEQPVKEGTNKSYRQQYHYRIYYLHPVEQGEENEAAVAEETGKLFNLLMQDTYLGGTCWYSQVVRVDNRPAEEEQLRRRGVNVRVTAIDLVATRAEMWCP